MINLLRSLSRLSAERGIVAPLVRGAHSSKSEKPSQSTTLLGESYSGDAMTNVTDRVISLVGRNLHNQRNHPLELLKRRITDYFALFKKQRDRPEFHVFDQLKPIVTVANNFDSLLVPPGHVSRSQKDSYFLNSSHMLRAHMTAHDSELIRQGLNAFILVGDVYRRDEIDSSHYPAFHQLDSVRIFTAPELFRAEATANASTRARIDSDLRLFDTAASERPVYAELNNEAFSQMQTTWLKDTPNKQHCHTFDAAKCCELELKRTLEGLIRHVLGPSVEYRWVTAVFPFTHPSWELEVRFGDRFVELAGCGVLRQEILDRCGVNESVAWAFGLGLERLAMRLYDIPAIRLFWSTDERFLKQFDVTNQNVPIKFKPLSAQPPCFADLSFWLPKSTQGTMHAQLQQSASAQQAQKTNDEEPTTDFSPNDFFEVCRAVGGDLLEKVELVDNFRHPKTGRVSHCYRIWYRSMERPLAQTEANRLHAEISKRVAKELSCEVRNTNKS